MAIPFFTFPTPTKIQIFIHILFLIYFTSPLFPWSQSFETSTHTLYKLEGAFQFSYLYTYISWEKCSLDQQWRTERGVKQYYLELPPRPLALGSMWYFQKLNQWNKNICIEIDPRPRKFSLRACHEPLISPPFDICIQHLHTYIFIMIFF